MAMRNQPGHPLASRQQQHPLDLFRRQFDSLFNRAFGNWPLWSDQDLDEMRVWDFNVTENDQEILVRAEMPGFEPNELDVHLDDNLLTIQAEKQQKGENQEAYRSFFRTITLPSSVDAEKVRADYRNGVLELHIPRPTGKQAKRIQVQGHQETAPNATEASTAAQPKGKK